MELLRAFAKEPGVRAYFTTRPGGCSPQPYEALNLGSETGDAPENVRRNWERVLKYFHRPLSHLCLPKLEHGHTLLNTEQCAYGDPKRCSGDAVYAHQSPQVLAVTAADCLPVLIYDKQNRAIAAIHAGWRGTLEKILFKTLSTLIQKEVMEAKHLLVALGPCISREKYEVGPEVASRFHPAFSQKTDEGKFRLDLRKANREQLRPLGLGSHQIEDFPHCTFTEPGLLYSYRRDDITGRQAGLIALA